MKEELKGPKVDDVLVAVVQEVGDLGKDVFNVYLVNLKSETLESVLVTSKGYIKSKSDGSKIETSVIRRNLKDIAPNSFQKIEPIIEDVFGLNNEYWVSFWIDKKMYDKRFIFLPETIKEENYVVVPLIDKKGVVIC